MVTSSEKHTNWTKSFEALRSLKKSPFAAVSIIASCRKWSPKKRALCKCKKHRALEPFKVYVKFPVSFPPNLGKWYVKGDKCHSELKCVVYMVIHIGTVLHITLGENHTIKMWILSTCNQLTNQNLKSSCEPGMSVGVHYNTREKVLNWQHWRMKPSIQKTGRAEPARIAASSHCPAFEPLPWSTESTHEGPVQSLPFYLYAASSNQTPVTRGSLHPLLESYMKWAGSFSPLPEHITKITSRSRVSCKSECEWDK